MRRYVTGCVVPVSDSSKYPSVLLFKVLDLDPEDEGTRNFQNVGDYGPKDRASHHRTN